MESACFTRWVVRYDALRALRKGYQAVLQVLKAMCDDNDEKYQTKETARGFVSSTKKLETGILLEVWSRYGMIVFPWFYENGTVS